MKKENLANISFNFLFSFTIFSLIIIANYYIFKVPEEKILKSISPDNVEEKEKEKEEEKYEVVYEDSSYLEDASLEQKIYWESYQRGRKALFGQMGIDLKNKDKKEFDYTSMISEEEIPEEEKAKYEEIRSKAYTEGYHRAASSFYCPR